MGKYEGNCKSTSGKGLGDITEKGNTLFRGCVLRHLGLNDGGWRVRKGREMWEC